MSAITTSTSARRGYRFLQLIPALAGITLMARRFARARTCRDRDRVRTHRRGPVAVLVAVHARPALSAEVQGWS